MDTFLAGISHPGVITMTLGLVGISIGCCRLAMKPNEALSKKSRECRLIFNLMILLLSLPVCAKGFFLIIK